MMGALLNSAEALIDEREVARVMSMSLASVRRWRIVGQGPKYLKIGSSVRYKSEDVRAFIESRPQRGGGQAEVNQPHA